MIHYLQHFHFNNQYEIALCFKVGTTVYASNFKLVVFYMKFLVFAYKLLAKKISYLCFILTIRIIGQQK